MLTICPTPIGNLDDVTARQRRALESADVVACEDSRRTGKLLERLGIERTDGRPRLEPYHEHNADEAVEKLRRALEGGREVVLVSDAGTPGISDPGYELVSAAVEAGVEIDSLPGPSAAIVALVGSGLPTDAFQFRGFPPSSDRSRRSFLRDIESADLTTILYEAPGRVVATLEAIEEIYGAERRVCLARERTKRHEEWVRGTVEEVREEMVSREEVRGECTLVVDRAEAEEGPGEEAIDRKIRELEERGLSRRTIREVVAELYDLRRSGLYDRIEDVLD